MSSKLIISVLMIVSLTSVQCKKSFLDKKPNTSLVNPQTVNDYRLLLDNTSIFNKSPSLGFTGSDDYYIHNSAGWLSIGQWERNASTWQNEVFTDLASSDDWNYPFRQIFLTNVIIEGLTKIEASESEKSLLENLKGEAYFNRAFAYLNLVSVFCKEYDNATASTDLGLPIRLKSGIDEIEQRSNLEETYRQIINDLSIAKVLLPASVPVVYKNRSSKPAAFACLSRLYLYIRDYAKAEMYADSVLSINSQLLDYKLIDTIVAAPFDRSNIEVLYHSTQLNSNFNAASNGTIGAVDTVLYSSYLPGDRRRPLFFRLVSGKYLIKRGYMGNTAIAFGGLTLSEVFLNKAECQARKGMMSEAMATLNALLAKRFDNTFVPLAASSAPEALNVILNERRKELVWKGVRWLDLKRLNREGRSIVLKRTVNGQQYTLAPNSPTYVYPIPPDEISLSGIQQNPPR